MPRSRLPVLHNSWLLCGDWIRVCFRRQPESCRYLQNTNSNGYEGGQRVVSEEKNDRYDYEHSQSSSDYFHHPPHATICCTRGKKVGHLFNLAKYKMKCVNCPFTYPTFNLFHDIHQERPGRNPSATKIALAYAIQNTAIGAEMIELLTGLDILAPSKSTDTRYNSCVVFSRKTPS